MYLRSGIAHLLFLLSYFPLFSFSSILEDRASNRGLFFDSTCDPYKSKIDIVIKSMKEEAKAAYLEAVNPQSLNFPQFFRPQDKARVRRVFRNVVQALNGYGTKIPVTCEETNVCLGGNAAYVEYQLDGNWQKDRINLCLHSIDGSSPTPIVSDFCAERLIGLSTAEYLLHELFHIYPIGNNTRIVDNVYAPQQCKDLAAGKARDQEGNILDPTYNAQNYLLFAWNTFRLQHLQDYTKCLGRDQGELRKLQAEIEKSTSECNSTHTLQPSETVASPHTAPTDLALGYSWVKSNLSQPYSPDNYSCNGNLSHSEDFFVVQVPANSSDIYFHV